ncbi:MAG: hypothetical protein R2729_19760 [Bryobacteraceae bacterium]
MNGVANRGLTPPDRALLEDIARRVGLKLSAEDFATVVQAAFAAAQGDRNEAVQEAALRECDSFDGFRGAIERAGASARETFGRAPRVLVLGAAEGVPARDSRYAAGVAVEALGSGCVVERREIGRPDLSGPWREGGFEIVISHSLAHFFFESAGVFGLVDAAVAAGGSYVMGNEPNRRYWLNGEIQEQVSAKAAAGMARKRVRRWLSPRGWLRWFGRRDEPGFTDRVNAILAERHGIQGPLTVKEINRIVDPYFPDEYPGEHALGAKGLDWEQDVRATLGGGFELEWTSTARFLGKQPRASLTPRWAAVHDELARRFPRDGSVISAHWRKKA